MKKMKRLRTGSVLLGLAVLTVAPTKAGEVTRIDVTGQFDAGSNGYLEGPNQRFELRWTLPVPLKTNPNFSAGDSDWGFQGSPGFSYWLDGTLTACTAGGSDWYTTDEGSVLRTPLYWSDKQTGVSVIDEFVFSTDASPGPPLYTGPASDPKLTPGVFPLDLTASSVDNTVETPDITLERETYFTGGQIAIGVPVVPERSPLSLVMLTAGFAAMGQAALWAKSAIRRRCTSASGRT